MTFERISSYTDILQGRMLHILPAKEMNDTEEESTGNDKIILLRIKKLKKYSKSIKLKGIHQT